MNWQRDLIEVLRSRNWESARKTPRLGWPRPFTTAKFPQLVELVYFSYSIVYPCPCYTLEMENVHNTPSAGCPMVLCIFNISPLILILCSQKQICGLIWGAELNYWFTTFSIFLWFSSRWFLISKMQIILVHSSCIKFNLPNCRVRKLSCAIFVKHWCLTSPIWKVSLYTSTLWLFLDECMQFESLFFA